MSFMRQALGIALMFSAAVEAADPPTATPAEKPAQAPATTPTRRAPLNLQVGDVRRYMMPGEYRAAISRSESDGTIVVEGDRPAPPLKSTQPLPEGLAAYYSLFRHPTKAWRLFLPDPNGVAAGPPDVVPKPEFRWGP